MKNNRAILYIVTAVIGFLLAVKPPSSYGQCRPGDVLVGEDEKLWYCSSPITGVQANETITQIVKENPAMLGEQWRFRKAVMDAAGSLARQGMDYRPGGKLRVTAEGRVTYICVSKECAGSTDPGIDCSGYVEYAGEKGACFVSAFYQAAHHSMIGLRTSAAGQAEYFKKHSAFRGRDARPNPGDLIFFEKTIKNSNGITHVAIFLGTTRDGRTLILHASWNAQRVIFASLSPDLAKKIVGYGDISQLYANSQ